MDSDVPNMREMFAQGILSFSAFVKPDGLGERTFTVCPGSPIDKPHDQFGLVPAVQKFIEENLPILVGRLVKVVDAKHDTQTEGVICNVVQCFPRPSQPLFLFLVRKVQRDHVLEEGMWHVVGYAPGWPEGPEGVVWLSHSSGLRVERSHDVLCLPD